MATPLLTAAAGPESLDLVTLHENSIFSASSVNARTVTNTWPQKYRSFNASLLRNLYGEVDLIAEMILLVLELEIDVRKVGCGRKFQDVASSMPELSSPARHRKMTSFRRALDRGGSDVSYL